MAFHFVLPLPSLVLHPLTSLGLCGVHVYLAVGHLSQLVAGDVQWTHVWKGFGALVGAYVFLALVSRSGKAIRGRPPEGDAAQRARASVLES